MLLSILVGIYSKLLRNVIIYALSTDSDLRPKW